MMGKFSTLYDRSRAPLYVQVASVMRQRVNSRRWAEGERISTLEELEEEFGVARVTIRQAIELLRAEGLLQAQQGRGTFVSGRPANNRWFNLATDFDSLVESIRNNVLKRVFIQRDAEPPALLPAEGNPAKAYSSGASNSTAANPFRSSTCTSIRGCSCGTASASRAQPRYRRSSRWKT
jgi:GntR family transcriptional regulator